jgi:phospholipase/lecithinase/hemolysin
MPFRFASCSRFRLFTCLGALLVFVALSTTALHAQSYDSIIVFGDSYNDVGNFYYLAGKRGVVYPPPPYYYGRFSDGPIWVDDLAGALGLPIAPSLRGGTDYAVGGAELLQTIKIQGVALPSIEDQVAGYLAATGGKADPNALYVIEGGGDDILNATTFSPNTLGPAIAGGLYGIEKSLRAAGGTSFLIPQLIDVGQLPAAMAAGPAFVTFADATSVAANQALASDLAADSKLPGIHIYNIPVFKEFLTTVSAPGAFGFLDTIYPCVNPGFVCTAPDHHLWWDAVHPSKFAHGYFAILAGAALYYQK